jgi:hypothetical protein
MDRLISTVPRGSSDIVMYFSKQSDFNMFHYAGLTTADLGYIKVVKMNWRNLKEPFKLAYYRMLHELGHVFGAMHIHEDFNRIYIMNPDLKPDRLFVKQGMKFVLREPEFHPGNLTVIRALFDRPFNAGGWPGDRWPKIKAAYEYSGERYIKSYIAEGNQIKYEKYDEIFRTDYYTCLSNWASLCGHDSAALVYADSALNTVRALDAKSPLFELIERDTFEAASHWRRAIIYLRSKKTARAEEEMKRFLQKGRQYNIRQSLLDKFTSIYELRNRLSAE